MVYAIQKNYCDSANIPLTSGFMKYGEERIDARLGFEFRTNTGIVKEIELL